jgi:dTDP-glucose pyrophosphorylase
MGGDNVFAGTEYQYPKPLIEIDGHPLIELVVSCLASIPGDKRYIFVVNARDCEKYHLDDVLRLISGGSSIVIQLESETKGAACSALMAVDYIDCDDELLISNSDHIIEHALGDMIREFKERGLDAGVACFDSVHPKWSFVRLDENGNVIETAEKRPLSRHAIAGLYYYRRGCDFVQFAKRMIEKDAHVNGSFYVAPTMNEMVLARHRIGTYSIPNDSYHNFYSPHKIKEYEEYLNRTKSPLAARVKGD